MIKDRDRDDDDGESGNGDGGEDSEDAPGGRQADLEQFTEEGEGENEDEDQTLAAGTEEAAQQIDTAVEEALADADDPDTDELNEVAPGNVVYDRENDGEVLVVEDTGQEAGDFVLEFTDDNQTLAEYNDADPEDKAVNVVFKSSVEDELEELGPEEVAARVRNGDISTREYPYPEGRLNPDFDPNALADLSQYDDPEEAFIAPYETRDAALEDVEDAWQYGRDMAVTEALGVANDFQEDIIPELNGRWSEIEDLGDNPEDYEAVVIHDGGDADGAMAGTLYKAKFGDAAVRMPANSGGNYGRGVDDGLEEAFEHAPGDMPIFIADLGPDNAERFEQLVRENENPVYVRDHHEVAETDAQREAVIEAVEENGGEYRVNTDAPAAAGMVWKADVNADSVDNPENLRDAVDVAIVADDFQTDHDRWSDADQMRSLQYRYTLGDFENAVMEHGGDYSDSSYKRELDIINTGENVQTELALETAETFTAGDYTGVRAYAGGGDRSTIADEAMERADADFAVMTTDGDKLSFRVNNADEAGGDLSAEEWAAEYNGGGRPEAGGASNFGYDTADTTEEEHIESHGEDLLNHATETVRTVIQSKADSDEDTNR